MANNPLIAQGTLNRIRGSVVIPGFPTLNITAPYLGKTGIRLALNGAATGMIETMTGTAISLEPYMMVSVSIDLLKTNGLAAIYKSQMEDTTALGNITVIPDTSALPTYQILNAAIESIGDQAYDGTSASWPLVIRGYYVINNSAFSLL